MESQSQGGFYLDDDERVPLRVRRKVLEQMKASELDDTKRASRQALALDRIVRAARKEMRSAIGARKFAQYRAAIGQRGAKPRLGPCGITIEATPHSSGFAKRSAGVAACSRQSSGRSCTDTPSGHRSASSRSRAKRSRS